MTEGNRLSRALYLSREKNIVSELVIAYLVYLFIEIGHSKLYYDFSNIVLAISSELHDLY